MKRNLILAIESSCDETAAAVVEEGRPMSFLLRLTFIANLAVWFRKLHPASISKTFP